jgi:hypothetical protein
MIKWKFLKSLHRGPVAAGMKSTEIFLIGGELQILPEFPVFFCDYLINKDNWQRSGREKSLPDCYIC